MISFKRRTWFGSSNSPSATTLGFTDESCAAEYGELLNAGLYIRGDLARLGGKAVLTLQLFSIKAGKIDAQRTVTLSTIDELAGQMKDETYALMGREVVGPQTAWYANPWTWVLVGAGGLSSAGFYALNHEPDPVTWAKRSSIPPSGPLAPFPLVFRPRQEAWYGDGKNSLPRDRDYAERHRMQRR